jgi:hypothetical protein
MFSVMRASVIMTRSPTRTNWSRWKRASASRSAAPKVLGSAVEHLEGDRTAIRRAEQAMDNWQGACLADRPSARRRQQARQCRAASVWRSRVWKPGRRGGWWPLQTGCRVWLGQPAEDAGQRHVGRGFLGLTWISPAPNIEPLRTVEETLGSRRSDPSADGIDSVSLTANIRR